MTVQLTSIMLAVTLVSCGQIDQDSRAHDQPEEAALSEDSDFDFEGSFSSGCFRQTVMIMENVNGQSKVSIKKYQNIGCTGTFTERKFERSFEVVGKEGESFYHVDVTENGEVSKVAWHGSSLGVTIDLGILEEAKNITKVNDREVEQLQIVMNRI